MVCTTAQLPKGGQFCSHWSGHLTTLDNIMILDHQLGSLPSAVGFSGRQTQKHFSNPKEVLIYKRKRHHNIHVKKTRLKNQNQTYSSLG